MCNEQGRASLGSTLQCIDNGPFGGRIKPTGRFIQDQDGGSSENRPRNGDALLLAAGKCGATLGDQGFITVWKTVNELGGIRYDCRRDNLLIAGVWTPESDVFADCPAEEQGVLQNETDLRAQGLNGKVSNVFAVNQEGAAAGIIEPWNQAYESAFARPGGPYNRDFFTGSYTQVDTGKLGLPGLVFERNIAELDFSLKPRDFSSSLPIGYFGTHAQDVRDSLGTNSGFTRDVGEPRQSLHRAIKICHVSKKDDHVASREMSLHDVRGAKPHH